MGPTGLELAAGLGLTLVLAAGRGLTGLVLAAGLVVAAGLALSACTSSSPAVPPTTSASAPSVPPPQAERVTLTNSGHGRTVHLRPGQELELRLVTCPHCSGAWALTSRPDPRVLRLVATRLAAPSRPGARPRKARRNELPGPVLTILTFRATSPGRTTLQATGPPGSPHIPGSSYRLTVIVTG